MTFSSGFGVGASVRQSRDAARDLAKEKNQELTKMGYAFNEDGTSMQVRPGSAADAQQTGAEIEAVKAQAKMANARMAAAETDDALLDFAHTGDANYLQSKMDNNPFLKQAWGERGVQLVSNIDFGSDTNLLANSGLSANHYDTPEKQDIIKRNAYKVYDGKDWSLGLLNTTAAETGALKRMGERKGGIILDNAQQFRDMMSGPKVSPFTAEGHKYQAEIMEAAEKYDLPPNLIASMIKQESNSNPNAVSSKGATGLMQLMEGTAKEMGVTDITNAKQNIMGGAKYMRQQLDKYDDDLNLALAAYNAGPGNVDKYGGIPPFGETQNYVKNITENLGKGEKFYNNTAANVAAGLKKTKPQAVLDSLNNDARDEANAAAGTTTELADAKVVNEITSTIRGQDQKDIELTIAKDALDVERQKTAAKLVTEGSTATQKDLSAAADKTNDFLAGFGNEEAFMSYDLEANPKVKRAALVYATEVEQLTGTELTPERQKTVSEINKLVALSGTAAEIDPKTVGYLDSINSNISKYITNDPDGVKAKSAMKFMGSILKSAMIGGSQTPQEIENFVSWAGTEKQELGPLLAQFSNMLEVIKTDVDTSASFMNPYVAKIRMGKAATDISKSIDTVNKSLEALSGTKNADGTSIVPKDKQKASAASVL